MGITDFFETDETVQKAKTKKVLPSDPNQKCIQANDLLRKNIINNKKLDMWKSPMKKCFKVGAE